MTFSLAAWLIHRLFLQLFGQFALSQSWMPVYPGFPIGLDPFGMWSRFDSTRYLDIMTKGYYPGRFGPAGWFPGYPLTAKALTPFLTPLQAGVALSGLCFFLALVVLLRLGRLDNDSSQSTRRGALLLLAFPSTFILSAVYSESLFLLLCLCSVWAVRKEHSKTACFLAALATLTRLTGLCLIPALAWEMWHRKRKLTWDYLFLLLPGMAVLAFFLFLQIRTGNFFAYFQVQGDYSQILSIWKTWSNGRPLMLEQKTGLVFLLLEVSLIVIYWNKLRGSYRWFVMSSLLIAFYHTQGVCSQRFLLTQFPLFLVAGNHLRGRWFGLSLTILLSLQMWLFTLWVYGYRATY